MKKNLNRAFEIVILILVILVWLFSLWKIVNYLKLTQILGLVDKARLLW